MTYETMLDIIADVSCFMDLKQALENHNYTKQEFVEALDKYKDEPKQIEYKGDYVKDLAIRLRTQIESL